MKLKSILEYFSHMPDSEFNQIDSFIEQLNELYLIDWKTKYYVHDKIYFFLVKFFYDSNLNLIIRASSSENKNGAYNYNLNHEFFDHLFKSRFAKHNFKILLNNKFNKMILETPKSLKQNELEYQFKNNLKNFLMKILL